MIKPTLNSDFHFPFIRIKLIKVCWLELRLQIRRKLE
ncbi:hypothetical protein Avbf_04020 [Armadillidium vulgare]|nr:hypothetical protein Avbf_04020 [Armadillidium vulgare]